MSEFAGLLRSGSSAPFYTEERCYISELLNTPQCTEVSLAECRVAPGVTTQLHSLSVAERYVIQQGRGVMELHMGAPFAIEVGDCVLIPADCPQRVVNTGTEDLVFLCVCTPRFEGHCYAVLETSATAPIEDVS